MKPAQVQHVLAQARQAFDARNLVQASGLCERVLGHSKRSVEALQLMGRIRQAQSRLDEAARCFERAVQLDPKNVEMLTDLAWTHMNRGKFNAALGRVDKALKLDAANLKALRVKACILDTRGDTEKLRTFLEPVVARHPDDATSGYYLARAIARGGDRPGAIDMLRGYLAGTSITDEQRRRLGSQLGAWLEREERFDDAFDAYVAANETEPLDARSAHYERFVDGLIETFTAERLKKLPRATHDLDQPILIVGMPRTGSSLLEQILDRHPKVGAAGESMALFTILAELSLMIDSSQGYPACIDDLTTESADRVGRAYVEALRKVAGSRVPRITDKHLTNYEALGVVSLVLPKARVLDCRRDPLSTCLSCYANDLEAHSYPYARSLDAIGHRYRQYERLMSHWHEVLDIDILRVDYEDVVDDQEGMTRRILEWLGLSWDERCLKFYESTRQVMTFSREQVQQPIYRRSVSRAERFGSRLDPLRQALGLPTTGS